MELTIDRGTLLDLLNATKGAVDRRGTLPILSHLLFDAAPESLTASATDLTVHLRTSRRAGVKATGGVALPAARLRALVSALSPGDVTVRQIDEGAVEVRSGRSKTKLPALPAADFPVFPEPKGEPAFVIESAALTQALERTLFAAADSKAGRWDLAGICMKPAGAGVRFVSSDGSARISEVTIEASVGDSAREVMLATQGVAELNSILGEGPAHFWLDGSVAHARTSSTELAMRLVDAKFVAYEQVIPKASKLTMALDRDAIVAALRRVAVAEDKFRKIRVQIESGQLTLTARDGVCESSESIDVDSGGVSILIGLDSLFLREALESFPERSTLDVGVTDSVTPLVIRDRDDETYRHVIMPMQP